MAPGLALVAVAALLAVSARIRRVPAVSRGGRGRVHWHWSRWMPSSTIGVLATGPHGQVGGGGTTLARWSGLSARGCCGRPGSVEAGMRAGLRAHVGNVAPPAAGPAEAFPDADITGGNHRRPVQGQAKRKAARSRPRSETPASRPTRIRHHAEDATRFRLRAGGGRALPRRGRRGRGCARPTGPRRGHRGGCAPPAARPPARPASTPNTPGAHVPPGRPRAGASRPRRSRRRSPTG